MAVSAINNYQNALYQWRGQKLASTGSGSSSSSSAANSLLTGASMTSQVSSMVELTKYAMDCMGLASDSRVTFSQITKYSNQLQSEFNNSVKKGLEDSGIVDMSSLVYTLGENGKITVSGGSHADCQKAQAWIDANPVYGETIMAAIKKNGLDSSGSLKFKLSSAGNMTLINPQTETMQGFLNNNEALSSALRDGLAALAPSYPLNLAFDGDKLIAKGDNAEEINNWLQENPAFEDALKKELEKNKIDLSAVTLRLGKEGAAQIAVNNANLNDIQAVLDKETQTGEKLYAALSSLGIDPNISFAIQFDDAGKLNIISDHPDRDKIQKFFEDNPELIKKYKQIEALAGIEDARKAMQISPSAMRKRIQIESMASWWAGSDSASSYFGQYSDNSLSLLAGLNLNV